jgi:hypothetical protein
MVSMTVTFTIVQMLDIGHHLRAAAFEENHDQGKSNGLRDKVKQCRMVEGDALAQHLHISVPPVEEHTSPRCQMRSATYHPAARSFHESPSEQSVAVLPVCERPVNSRLCGL